jgi:hypothetical protein
LQAGFQDDAKEKQSGAQGRARILIFGQNFPGFLLDNNNRRAATDPVDAAWI